MEMKRDAGFLSRIFLKEAKPFTTKRDLNVGVLAKAGGAVVVITVVILLFLPAPKPKEDSGFKSKSDTAIPQQQSMPGYDGGGMPSDYAARSAARGFDALSGLSGPQAGGGRGSGRNLNSAMILSRQGADAKTQLPPGSRFPVRITQAVVAGSQPVPVIGELSSDVLHDSDVALPRGSRVLGEVAFDEESERARVTWRAVIFPDGRQRDLAALGMGGDGQLGVEGRVHSEALKNTIGQTLSRFIGAYAEGSMTRNVNGYSSGGTENGLRNAFGQTAQDRAQAWADDLKKEKKWVELPAGYESLAVLSQPFNYKDPGSIH